MTEHSIFHPRQPWLEAATQRRSKEQNTTRKLVNESMLDLVQRRCPDLLTLVSRLTSRRNFTLNVRSCKTVWTWHLTLSTSGPEETDEIRKPSDRSRASWAPRNCQVRSATPTLTDFQKERKKERKTTRAIKSTTHQHLSQQEDDDASWWWDDDYVVQIVRRGYHGTFL